MFASPNRLSISDHCSGVAQSTSTAHTEFFMSSGLFLGFVALPSSESDYDGLCPSIDIESAVRKSWFLTVRSRGRTSSSRKKLSSLSTRQLTLSRGNGSAPRGLATLSLRKTALCPVRSRCSAKSGVRSLEEPYGWLNDRTFVPDRASNSSLFLSTCEPNSSRERDLQCTWV